MKNCPLCNVESLEGQKVVFENDYCLFLQMPQEVLIGSGLIVPKAHRETLFELTKQEWVATYEILHDVKQLLDEQLNPEGYNVGWNYGEVGGQHIFHAHLHVIPRFADEPYAGRGIRSWLKSAENKRW
ncbi:HIT family protein [Bacillus luteolus]|uniref:HIT family protein n=1 Tax=Litchfieldia luteola TaxID=682179 RepID=A0ABR9QM30_9BACI|nr:HIT family protein [Cytobacillus luteolus]MBE4909544.1 HIT family protein [Cytobacillus luteolus]MBP1940945.1 histidine triad (HIT) family protein [Cytobacillus luteolus]